MPFRLFQFSNFFIKKTDFTFSIRLNKQKTKIGRHSRPWPIFGQLTMACFDLPMGGWNGVVFNSNPGIEVNTRVFILVYDRTSMYGTVRPYCTAVLYGTVRTVKVAVRCTFFWRFLVLKRNHLNPENLEKLVFCRQNLPKVNFQY